MANQYGSIKVVAYDSKKKTDNNCDYFRASVKILKGGNCFGNQGPLIFILKGNTVGQNNYVNLITKVACHTTLM